MPMTEEEEVLVLRAEILFMGYATRHEPIANGRWWRNGDPEDGWSVEINGGGRTEYFMGRSLVAAYQAIADWLHRNNTPHGATRIVMDSRL